MVGELERVADQVHQDLTQADVIAGDLTRHRGLVNERQRDALLPRPDGHQFGDVADQGDDVDRPRFDRQLAGLDLRQIQQVVEQRQKVLPVAIDRIDPLALFGGQFRLEHLGEPEHGGQRRPQFVRDVREEFRLRLAGPQQPLLDLVLSGDVMLDADVIRHRPGIIAYRGQLQIVPERFTAASVIQNLDLDRIALIERPTDGADRFRIGLRSLQEPAIASERVVGLVTGHPVEPLVGVGDRFAWGRHVDDQDSVDGRFDGVVLQGQLPLAADPFGDVADGDEEIPFAFGADTAGVDLGVERRPVGVLHPPRLAAAGQQALDRVGGRVVRVGRRV